MYILTAYLCLSLILSVLLHVKAATDFRVHDTSQERIVLKSIEIDMDKLHMKFSALNKDFDGPRNLRTKASNSGTPVKVVILPLLASFS